LIKSNFFFIFSFKANVRLDSNERKVNLFPIEQKKEDYVQSELRRLRENLRSESFKMRRPRQLVSFFKYLKIIFFFIHIVKLMNHLFIMI
jgi:hypothetical protein